MLYSIYKYMLNKKNVTKLTSKLKGKQVEIVALNFTDEWIKHKLENIGFIKGVKVNVLNNNDSNNVLHLQLFNVQYVLREENCKFIDVKII